MPVTVHVSPAPRLRVQARRAPEQVIHQAADAAAVELRTFWQGLLEDVRALATLRPLREALRTRNALATEGVIASWVMRAIEAPARALLPFVFRSTMDAVASQLTPAVALTLGADPAVLAIPASLPWVEAATGAQIVQVTDTTVLAMRELVRTQLEAGTSVQQMAVAIRAEIGLTPRQMRMVEALRVRLETAGVSPAELARQVEVATRKGIQQRALVIARTESIAAANAGQQELWRHAVTQGYMDPAEWQRQWLTAQDEHVCPVCAPMDGQRRGMEEPFLTGDGASVLFPTAHPNCRCTMVLVAATEQDVPTSLAG